MDKRRFNLEMVKQMLEWEYKLSRPDVDELVAEFQGLVNRWFRDPRIKDLQGYHNCYRSVARAMAARLWAERVRRANSSDRQPQVIQLLPRGR